MNCAPAPESEEPRESIEMFSCFNILPRKDGGTPCRRHVFYSVLFWAGTGLEVPDGTAGLDPNCMWILRTWLLPAGAVQN